MPDCRICPHADDSHDIVSGCIECRCPVTDTAVDPRGYIQGLLTSAAVAFDMSDLEPEVWTEMLREAISETR